MISKTEFKITKMDCPSEEQLIRMKLQNFDNIKLLEFDIPNRKLNVYHYGNAEHILKALNSLNPFSSEFLGYKLIGLFGDLLKNLFVPSDNFL